MLYCSPFCPDDDKIITKNGAMKISKLYYKMNPRRDPYNKILDVQNFFLSKCVSIDKNKNLEKKIQKQNSLKELRDINEYYNNVSKTGSQILSNQEEIPYYYNDYSNLFQTAIGVSGKTNYSNINLHNSGTLQNIDNTKMSSNFIDSSININSNKPKLLNHSNSYIIKLDKMYYKSPTLNRKVYILNNKNRREAEKSQPLFRISKSSSIYFDDSDMSKYSEIIPLSRQNYLNEQFDFDKEKANTLTYLKQYQIKETQNRTKSKPFIH